MKGFHSFLTSFSGIFLLAAAVLKWMGGPIEGWGLGSYRVFILAEMSLGIVMLSGVWRRAVTLVTCLCFIVFAGVNVAHISSGRASCGCFGAVQVSPWITLALDLAFAITLGWCVVARPILQASPGLMRLSVTAVVAIVMTTMVLWPVPALPASVSLSHVGTASGNLIVLEPEAWMGKPFALADFIPRGETLKTGRWIVLLYHNGCSTCEKVLPAFREFLAVHPNGQKIALIELPPHEDGDVGGWGDFNASLPDNHDWFATTPVVIAVETGIVKATVSGDAAIDADGFLRQAGFGEH